MSSVAYLAISNNTSCRVWHKKRCMIYGKTSTGSLRNYRLNITTAALYGETLSRVTNDIDTIGSTLQQSLTQFITSVVTIVGILIMMLTISPVLTLIALVSLPLSLFGIRPILKRSQKHFADQQRTLGQLNSHVEEMYTGHQVVKAFGHERKSVAEFDEVNEQLYDAGRKAQFISGIIMPMMSLIGNLSYVVICVVGGILVTQRAISIGDIQAFITYTRQFTQPIMQTANIANIIQSTVAAAERVFELLDEEEEVKEVTTVSLTRAEGTVSFEHVDFGYGDDLLIEDMNIDVTSRSNSRYCRANWCRENDID